MSVKSRVARLEKQTGPARPSVQREVRQDGMVYLLWCPEGCEPDDPRARLVMQLSEEMWDALLPDKAEA